MAEMDAAVEPGHVEPNEQDATPKRTYGSKPKPGQLLELQNEELGEHAHRLWKAQDPRWERRLCEYRLNERRRNGEKGIWVRKQENVGRFEVWAAPGVNRAPIPVYNKADRDCHNLTSQVFADEYKPEVEPSGDTDEERDSADVAQRVLDDVDSEGNLNDQEHQKAAFDLAHTGGSGYIFYYLDPYAGGRRPIEVQAGEEALDMQTATRNPLTGEPWSELKPRYVTEDGMLTDDENEAARDWWPRLDACEYHARHIRFLPWDSQNVWDADGVLIAEYRPVSQLRRMYPKAFEGKTDEQIRDLALHRPKGWHELLPMRDGKPWDPPVTDDTPTDDLLCAHLRVIYTESGDYPDGAYVCVLGKETIGKRGKWIGQDEKGRFKLDLPVSQTKLWRKAGDPHGTGTMDALGDASEARAAIMGMFFDYLDQVGNLKWFLPATSTLSGKEWLLQTNLPFIPINPGGEPRRQDLPPLPKEVGEVFSQISREMDDSTRLQETAQGVDTSTAQSGRAKLAVISQVHALLSQVRSNVIQAHIRSWRIKLQLMRMGYTKEQKLQYVGEDGRYKLTRWAGSDLAGVKDVTIRPGSGTMLPPLQKIEQALSFQQAGLVQQPDLLDVIGHQVGSIVGFRDNPHVQRARREVAEWENGPPQDETGQPRSMPQQPVMGPVMGPMGPLVQPDGQPAMQPQIGPDGQPMMQDVPDPEGVKVFTPRAVDQQPDVAMIRMREFGRAMASTKYENFPRSWQMALEGAYQQAAMAAAPKPPPQAGAPAPQPAGAPNPASPPQLSQAEQAQAGNQVS